VFVEDSSGKISIDQLVTSLFGLTIEVIETNPIDTGIFSVLVGTSQEKQRLLNMGCLEINNFLLTITGKSDSDEIQCPICTISMKNWNESERNNHIITCSNDSAIDTPVVPSYISDGPFSLCCPYPNCGLKMQARLFPSHTFQKHSKDKQNYACPICLLQGDSRYKVKVDTNLMTHLQTSHPDLMESFLPSELQPLIPQKKPPIIFHKKLSPPPLKLPLQPSDYLVQIIQNDTQDECPICYEFLIKGIKIARLPCLCVYHQHCIEAWFKQKTARKCPLHGMDNS